MSTTRADWDLLALMRANVGDETDPAKVRRECEDAIAEFRARRRAREVQYDAHLAYLSVLRDPTP